MAKHLLFIVHGMGDDAEGWHTEIETRLSELYSQYEVAKFLPFDQQFEVKPLFYNDKFDSLRKKWEEAASQVLPLMKTGPLAGSALTTVTEWAGKLNKDDFVRTHVLDVVLYRFFPTVAQQVRAAVHKQLLDALSAVPANEVITWSAIAHSLGSSILHDTLLWMFSPQAPGALPPGGFRASVIAMLANVSRLLEDTDLFGEAGDAYKSVVQPNVDPGKGVCDTFINARHMFDPIPVPKAFRPAGDWPDVATRAAAGRFHDIRPDVITDPNVHGFLHYLNDPEAYTFPCFARSPCRR